MVAIEVYLGLSMSKTTGIYHTSNADIVTSKYCLKICKVSVNPLEFFREMTNEITCNKHVAICHYVLGMYKSLDTFIKLSRTMSSRSATWPMLPQIFACMEGYIYNIP